jgi:hypothetical protein
MTPLIFFEFGEVADAESGFRSVAVPVNVPVAAKTPIELRSKGKAAAPVMALLARSKNLRRLLLFIRADPDVDSVTYEPASSQQSHERKRF